MATIQKRGDSYRIRVSAGYDSKGKQLIKSMTWKPDSGMTARQIEKELNRQATLFEERVQTGQLLSSNMRFSGFTELWLEKYAATQLKAKTMARYKDLLSRILPAIGHIRLDRLQPHHLLAFYENLAEAGVRIDRKHRCTVDFKALLKSRSLTKVKLAEQTGLSLFVLNSITQGKNISDKSAQAIAAALGEKVSDYFTAIESDHGLAPKTILNHHSVISTILNTAVQWQVIFANPCDRVKPPRTEKTEPRYLDDQEVLTLLELLESVAPSYRTAVKLLLYTGMRRGELLGLEWNDVDFNNQVIHIRRESLYLPEKGIFVDDGKTAASIRSMKVASGAFEMLKEYKMWQDDIKDAWGDQWKETNRLFTASKGKPMHPDTLSGWFRKFILKTNLPEISIHSLRHTNATLLIAKGTAVTTVAKRLGHVNASTTTKIYAHAIRSADEAAAETLETLLTPSKPGETDKNKKAVAAPRSKTTA